MSLRLLSTLVAGLLSGAHVFAQSSFVNWEDPHVHPLELTPDGTKLLAVNTADARLEVFDTTGPRLVRLFDVAVGLDPQVPREVPVLVLRPLGGVARVRDLRRDADKRGLARDRRDDVVGEAGRERVPVAVVREVREARDQLADLDAIRRRERHHLLRSRLSAEPCRHRRRAPVR
jgi:hypothetical protein